MEEGSTCPVLLGRDFHDELTAYEWAEKGVLPESGGWQEQDAWWVESIRIISGQVEAVRAERIRRQQEAEKG